MVIKLKNKDAFKYVINGGLIAIYLVFVFLNYKNNRNLQYVYLVSSFIFICILSLKIFIKEIRLLFVVTALNKIISKINDNEITISEIEKEMKEYPNFLKVKNTSDGVIKIAKSIKELKNNIRGNENEVNILMSNVIKNLDNPVMELKEKIEDLQINYDEKDIEILKRKEEVVENLVLDIFTTAKSMNLNIPLELIECDLNYVLRQIIGEFSSTIENSNLIYDVEIDKEKFMYKIDSEKFFEVIKIVLENAEKHSLEKSRIYIKSKINNNGLRIEIKNISKKKLDIKSNEIFNIVKNKRDFSVTGLPLEKSKALIKSMKGTFNIEIDGDLFKVIINFMEDNSHDIK
ncbi:sensor histidine kinase [Clostridium thermobutyricum]|uniref:sensor histidine kinase n=1 Tax=Clostridium thermobutyricum TaxID=29372 RepID=UPI003F527CC3